MDARSDAQGHSHIATRALLPSDLSVSTHIPKWFVEMAFGAEEESPIYLFELAATVLTACLVAYRSDGNPRTFASRAENNKDATDSIIKGSSSPAIYTILDNLFWSVTARFPVVWRFGYVNARSNAAGPPSRLCDAPSGSPCSRSPEFARIFPVEDTPAGTRSV